VAVTRWTAAECVELEVELAPPPHADTATSVAAQTTAGKTRPLRPIVPTETTATNDLICSVRADDLEHGVLDAVNQLGGLLLVNHQALHRETVVLCAL
jgi:hypothetical protein